MCAHTLSVRHLTLFVAVRLLYARLRTHDFLPTKKLGGKHDNKTALFTSPQHRKGDDPPRSAHAVARRRSPRRFRSSRANGVGGERRAVGPNRRSNHGNPAAAALGPSSGARYPDARLELLKKKGVSLGPTGFPAFAGTMAVERVATGFRWAEGPVYFPAGRYVLFSDIPNNRIMRFYGG